jgi:hypothetical protein
MKFTLKFKNFLIITGFIVWMVSSIPLINNISSTFPHKKEYVDTFDSFDIIWIFDDPSQFHRLMGGWSIISLLFPILCLWVNRHQFSYDFRRSINTLRNFIFENERR